MAFKKTLVQRLFNLSRFSTPNMSRNCGKQSEQARATMSPDPGESTRLKRIIQRRPLYQSATSTSSNPLRLFPLSEKLKTMDISKNRITLDGLIMPIPDIAQPPTTTRGNDTGLSVSDVRKVIRASQMENIRNKLRKIETDWISYDDYINVCKESCDGNVEQGLYFSKSLDESGSVIVLGSAVCLRPHQVANALHNLIQPSMTKQNDPRREELELMEEHKAEIDRKADGLVRRELWAGLGYMVVQTAAFMRLTFWELSWDVMEPICFYVTSAYFMGGYAFFLRTSKEPSFEGFFQSRFNAKQIKLMKARNFDIERYNELRKVFYPKSSSSLDDEDHSKTMIKFGDHQNI